MQTEILPYAIHLADQGLARKAISTPLAALVVTVLVMGIEATLYIEAEEFVVVEEVVGGMRVEIAIEIETEIVAEKWTERETIEICDEIIEGLWCHSETKEAAIENGVLGIVSKEGGLLHLLVEEDLLITIVEILVMRPQA